MRITIERKDLSIEQILPNKDFIEVTIPDKALVFFLKEKQKDLLEEQNKEIEKYQTAEQKLQEEIKTFENKIKDLQEAIKKYEGGIVNDKQ